MATPVKYPQLVILQYDGRTLADIIIQIIQSFHSEADVNKISTYEVIHLVVKQLRLLLRTLVPQILGDFVVLLAWTFTLCVLKRRTTTSEFNSIQLEYLL